MRILYLEDNPSDAELVRRTLSRAATPHEVTIAPTLAAARALLVDTSRPGTFDLALVDLDLPDGSGIELVLWLRERQLPMAVVVLTGSGDERSAVAALKAGADDYLVKGTDHLRQLPAVVESARDVFHANLARRTRPLRVLYAEHNSADVDIARRHLARHTPHIQLEAMATADAVLARLADAEPQPDVLLLDYRLLGLDALELIGLIQSRGLARMPIIIVTGHGDEAVAVRALRMGVADYLVKRPGYLHELGATLENAHHRAQLWSEQQALRESEERFRQLAENIDEVFWITTPDHAAFLYVSPAFAKVWGHPVESLQDRPRTWIESITPEDRMAVLEWREALAQRAGSAIEYRIHRADGTVRWIRDRGSPVRDATGRVYRVVGVAEDITERRHLEEQLRQAQKMEAIGQLSGGVAHDFNNLLTIIQGHLGLLELNGHIRPPIAASLEQISEAATRASNLTRQLLTFSRKQVMQSRELNLCAVVTDLAKMLQRILGEDVRLEVTGGDTPLFVRADPGMMEQVLMNLTVNARDAMPRGGRLDVRLDSIAAAEMPLAELGIDAQDCPASHYVLLLVADTGMGIAPEVIGHIFEPFFTTKPVGKGTGLGLATVYGIVRQHRGGVRVRSRPGEGAAFEVYLPRVTATADTHATAPPALLDPVDPPRPTLTILLVEDDESVSKMVNLALACAGYRVLLATSGPQALALWEHHREEIALLLTDYVMPDGMSGRDLAERILAVQPSLPVLYMSGYSQEIAGREIAPLHMAHFLSKPFDLATLHQAVRDALGDAGA